MHTAKELAYSDVPFIYDFFKAIYGQTSHKFNRSREDHILYATRHAKLSLRPKFHILTLELDDSTIYYEAKEEVACIFSLEADLPALGNLEKLFATISRDARLT